MTNGACVFRVQRLLTLNGPFAVAPSVRQPSLVRQMTRILTLWSHEPLVSRVRAHWTTFFLTTIRGNILTTQYMFLLTRTDARWTRWVVCVCVDIRCWNVSVHPNKQINVNHPMCHKLLCREKVYFLQLLPLVIIGEIIERHNFDQEKCDRVNNQGGRSTLQAKCQ